MHSDKILKKYYKIIKNKKKNFNIKIVIENHDTRIYDHFTLNNIIKSMQLWVHLPIIKRHNYNQVIILITHYPTFHECKNMLMWIVIYSRKFFQGPNLYTPKFFQSFFQRCQLSFLQLSK